MAIIIKATRGKDETTQNWNEKNGRDAMKKVEELVQLGWTVEVKLDHEPGPDLDGCWPWNGPDPGQKVIDYLESHSEPVTLKELVKILNIKSRGLRGWMDIFKREGRVFEDEQGRFTKMIRVDLTPERIHLKRK